MISWKNHWSKEVSQGLDFIKIGGRAVLTYRDMPKNLYQALNISTERYPDKIAVVNFDGKSYSYSKFLNMVDRFADMLTAKFNIRKGTHVGMLLYNGIEFCVSYLALCKLGAVVVSLPGKLQKPEILSLAKKAELSCLICEEHFYSWFEQETKIKRILSKPHKDGVYGLGYLMTDAEKYPSTINESDWNDPIILMFTSGTTSQSKGVLLKNYNIMHSVEAYIRTLQLTEKDVSIVSTPMYHITGLVCITAVSLTSGGELHILEKVDPNRVLQRCIDSKVTYFHASPTVFSMLLDAREKYPSIPSIKSFACGSGNMSPKNIMRLKDWMPNADFHTVFGMTETSGAGTIFPIGAASSKYIGSSGVPMPNLEIKIIDDDGKELPNGETGEVCIRSSFVLESYYKLDHSDLIDEDGWLKTGDVGYCNDEGYLWIADRKKDMINRGGEKICSFDIEDELHMLPGVLDAAVVGIPDEKYMEVPVAAVKMKRDISWDNDKMLAILKTRIAKYKIPVKVLVVDEIPKTANGKVDKREVKKLFV